MSQRLDDLNPRPYEILSLEDFVENPLSAALRQGSIEIVKLLLRRGADPWLDLDKWGRHYSVIATAMESNLFTEFLEWIQEDECTVSFDVNKKERFGGKRMIHWAVRHGQKKIVDQLTLIGAEVGATDAHGKTPVHLAVEYNQKGIADQLILNGADIGVRDTEGKTPLHYAVQAQYQENLEMVKYLVFCGADTTLEDNEGRTALQLALQLAKPDGSPIAAFLDRVSRFGCNRLDSAEIRQAYEEFELSKSLGQSHQEPDDEEWLSDESAGFDWEE